MRRTIADKGNLAIGMCDARVLVTFVSDIFYRVGNSHLFQSIYLFVALVKHNFIFYYLSKLSLKYSKTNFLLSIIMCFAQVIISPSGSEEIWICVNIYRRIIVIRN